MADYAVQSSEVTPKDGGKVRRTACTTSFRGREATVMQVPREKTEDGQDNTGWSVWECSNICLRYLASDDNVRHILNGTAAVVPSGEFRSLSIVDLSAGAGLLAIAFAAAEAAVVAATDIPAQLPQLWDNVALGGCAPRLVDAATGEDVSDAAAVTALGVAAASAAEPSASARAHPVSIVPLFWGESLAPLDSALRRARAAAVTSSAAAATAGPSPSAAWPFPASDIVVASDILFIALRDGRAPELRRTLVRLLRQRLCSAVVFGYEERLFREEDAWMRALGLGTAWGSTDASPAGAEGAAYGGAGSSASASASPAASASASAAANDALDDDAFQLWVEELTGPATSLEWEDSLAKAGAGGLGATEGADLFVPYLFWEPPPVRLFILRLPPGAAALRPPPIGA